MMSRPASPIVWIASCLVVAWPACGATLHVPADYPTIQAAIDAAPEGDTVIVSPGIWRENIDFRGKALTVRSVAPESRHVVGSTVIQACRSDRAVVTFPRAETGTARLQGMTIVSLDRSPAAGVACFDSSPRVDRCVFRNDGLGPAVHCRGGAATFRWCEFEPAQAEQVLELVRCDHAVAGFDACRIQARRLGGPSNDTYNLDGKSLASELSFIEFDPALRSGAVYQRTGWHRAPTRFTQAPTPPVWGRPVGTPGSSNAWVFPRPHDPACGVPRAVHRNMRRRAASDPALFYAPYLAKRWSAQSRVGRRYGRAWAWPARHLRGNALPHSVSRPSWDPALYYAPYLKN